MKHPVVHFEIYSDDPVKLAGFYKSLFDWRISEVPGMDYWTVSTVETDTEGMPKTPGGINGGLMKRPPGYEERAWTNYVSVESIDGAVDKALTLGAQIMKAKAAVPGMGWFAVLRDPQHNVFALWQSDKAAA